MPVDSGFREYLAAAAEEANSGVLEKTTIQTIPERNWL